MFVQLCFSVYSSNYIARVKPKLSRHKLLDPGGGGGEGDSIYKKGRDARQEF